MDVDQKPLPPNVGTGVETDLPHRPLRLLEDEQVHLQRSGIKLTDFEVRGTLGMSFIIQQ
jgi:protein kinase A